jgi:hypothetical protein
MSAVDKVRLYNPTTNITIEYQILILKIVEYTKTICYAYFSRMVEFMVILKIVIGYLTRRHTATLG